MTPSILGSQHQDFLGQMQIANHFAIQNATAVRYASSTPKNDGSSMAEKLIDGLAPQHADNSPSEVQLLDQNKNLAEIYKELDYRY